VSEIHLFSPLEIRSVVFRNRIAVSPMCQYSCEDGFATDWHLVHLGSRAVGGAALVMTEATAVEARGRITPGDLGIYKEEHIAPLARVAAFIKQHGAVAGIQIAHAGRKASCHVPWDGGLAIPESEGGWQTVAPSPIPFLPSDPMPDTLTKGQIRQIVESFSAAARRALSAGFELLEIHAAHGYLLHEFLSPLSNQRTDTYGGSLKNRMRFLTEVVDAVRSVWPERLPLFVRISASDWKEGGWDIDESVELAKTLKGHAVDLIDCSSGGLVPDAKIPAAPGFQVPFAERIKREAGIATGAVGMITEPQQADEVIRCGRADIISLARQFLRDPYWPLHAAQALGLSPRPPVQYSRAFPA
jgi:2,4-dienoyl-CoA reductase-like NADH-dependent reductase (Old Yellow Enzyme family)